jgi:predicted anti-sigma-YlaC factor YlaD
MEREALSSVKILYPSIVDCQGQEVEVGGLVSSGRGKEIGGFQRGS